MVRVHSGLPFQVAAPFSTCGCRTRLPPTAFERLRVAGEFIRQKLQSDKASEFNVLGLIDDTHPATAQFLDDAVVRDDLADELGWGDHLREC